MDEILEMLILAITAAWVFAAVAAYKFKNMFAGGSGGWTFVMYGSIFMLIRLLLKYYPGYSDKETSLRFMFGCVAGALLTVGFYKLYKEAKSLMSF